MDREKAMFKIWIRGSIQAVWNEITKTNEPQGCFFNTQLHTFGLVPGAGIQMRTASGKYTIVIGEVLEFDPPHRYVHTFRFTQHDDPPCKVIYNLREHNGGVEFELILEDLPVGTKTTKSMKGGGKMIVDTLKAIVEKGRPSLMIRCIYRLMGWLEPLTAPRRCRTENWPLESPREAVHSR